jgi:hypothetical protein
LFGLPTKDHLSLAMADRELDLFSNETKKHRGMSSSNPLSVLPMRMKTEIIILFTTSPSLSRAFLLLYLFYNIQPSDYNTTAWVFVVIIF